MFLKSLLSQYLLILILIVVCETKLIEAFMALKILSFSGYLFMIIGVISLLNTKTLFSVYFPSVLLQIFAFILMLWARKTFGVRSFHLVANPTEGELVTTGPYKLIRHPIYTALCLFVFAPVFVFVSIKTLIFVLLVFIGAIIRIFCEEHFLLQIYPEYKSYSKKTKRMLPFIF